MSDLYSELLVKKERTAKDRLVKGSIIALIVLLVLAGLFIMPPLLIAAIVLGVCAYLFIFPGTDLEFEYLFVNGELDIDKITYFWTPSMDKAPENEVEQRFVEYWKRVLRRASSVADDPVLIIFLCYNHPRLIRRISISAERILAVFIVPVFITESNMFG